MDSKVFGWELSELADATHGEEVDTIRWSELINIDGNKLSASKDESREILKMAYYGVVENL